MIVVARVAVAVVAAVIVTLAMAEMVVYKIEQAIAAVAV